MIRDDSLARNPLSLDGQTGEMVVRGRCRLARVQGPQLMVFGGAAAGGGIFIVRGRGGGVEPRLLLALLGAGVRIGVGGRIERAAITAVVIVVIVQAAVLLGRLGGRDVGEGGADALFAALPARVSGSGSGGSGGFHAGFRVVRGCGVGAWVVGGVAVAAAAAGGGGCVRVEAVAEDAGAEGHDGRFQHGEAGAHDAGVGFDGGPDGGVEGAVDLVGGLGAVVEGRHAEDGGDTDAGGGGGVSFSLVYGGIGGQKERRGELQEIEVEDSQRPQCKDDNQSNLLTLRDG